jgi:uncharacterized protein YbbK (DUF523 family)
MASSFSIIPFCPEQLGGLPTPREPASIVGGDGRDLIAGRARVINATGEDVTGAFSKGAEESLRIARLIKVKIALLKEKSPSCGLSTPYCDREEGSGIGITAALFNESGIKVLGIDGGDEFPELEFVNLFKEVYGETPAWSSKSHIPE